jgi:disulfide bond formation protein DsbB
VVGLFVKRFMMEMKIVTLALENRSNILAILGSILVLYGLWSLIYHALPGDCEMFIIIQQVRALKSKALDQAHQIAKEAGESYE